MKNGGGNLIQEKMHMGQVGLRTRETDEQVVRKLKAGRSYTTFSKSSLADFNCERKCGPSSWGHFHLYTQSECLQISTVGLGI